MSEVEERTDAVDEQEAPLPSGDEAVSVGRSTLSELVGDVPEGAMGMSALIDVPVQVTVEVGRASKSLGELCRLGPGSLLELNREAHEPADILVNGKVVARGEIVTVDGCYAVRITDLD